MNSSTQESPTYRRNPFEHYPKTIPLHYSNRGSAAAINTARAHAANIYTGPQPGPVSPLKAVPRDAQSRAQRRQQFLKKRQFAIVKGLQRVAKVLAAALLIFILLPTSMQHKVYQILPFANVAPKVTVSLPPLPVNYDYISSPFGRRWGRQHQGIDFAADVGEPIFAALPGTVVHSGWEHGYGKSIVIDHGNGMQTRYGHCSRLLVKKGEVIAKGGKIGLVGSTGHSTGPHLHFEVIVDGIRKNPAKYFTFANHDASHLATAREDED